MTLLRISLIWLALAFLFGWTVWPMLADHINARETSIKRWLRLHRLRRAWARAEEIIEQEKAIERARVEAELESRVSAIMRKLDREYAMRTDERGDADVAFALDAHYQDLGKVANG